MKAGRRRSECMVGVIELLKSLKIGAKSIESQHRKID